jgi:hypothetical protein
VLVLDHFIYRAWESEEEANMIVNANTLSHVNDLLQSSDPNVLLYTCRMLRNLAYYGPLNKLIVDFDPCPRLVSLLTSVFIYHASLSSSELCSAIKAPAFKKRQSTL